MLSTVPKEEQINSARRYYWLKEWNKAIQEYEQLRMSYPGDIEVLQDLAVAYRRVGQENKAAQILQEALDCM
jgi:tetratricopeptide (TPR) repeat protein